MGTEKAKRIAKYFRRPPKTPKSRLATQGNPDLLFARDEVQGARGAGTETYMEIC